MPEVFAEKLTLILKALSLSRAHLAAEMDVDKSVVARWALGTAKPSAYNLARLSQVMAQKAPGFTALDWDREADDFIALFGVGPRHAPADDKAAPKPGLVLPFIDQILSVTSLRASAYQGFYRTTRCYPEHPDRFLHDACMVRLGDDGLLRLSMTNDGVVVEGWVLPMHNQLFIIASEFNSGSLIFAMLHGVSSVQVDVLDGLTLVPSLDRGRTPTAACIVLKRVGGLSGDPAADDARFDEMRREDPIAPEGSVPEALRRHLMRDIEPGQAATIGSWLQRLPLADSIACGAPPGLR